MSLAYSRNAADSSGADDAAMMEEVLVTWNDSEEMQAVQYSIVPTTWASPYQCTHSNMLVI